MPKKEDSKRKEKGKSKKHDSKSVWDATSTKGKITQECLWTACKAMSAGFFLILVGTGMATLGFYSDVLSKVERKQGNHTVYQKDETKDSHLSSLTYLGPAVMGIGGFIILAACVMTFEARDTASKIVPAFFRKSRIHALQGMGSSPSRHSSDTSWERFLANSCWRGENSSKTRSLVTRELKNFSKKLQSSIDSAKLATVEEGISTNTLKKCPSEPFVSRVHQLLAQNTVKEEEKVTLPLPEMGKPKPKSLLVAANIYRQAASMDCPKRALQRQEAQDETTAPSEPPPPPPPQPKTHLPVQRSESNSSMAMDLYLPQGAVTLHVKDKTKGKKDSTKHARQMSVSEVNESQVSQSAGLNLDVDKSNQEGRRNRSPALSKQQTEITPKRRMSLTHQTHSTHSMRRNPLMRQAAIDVTQESSPKSTHSTEPA